MSGGEIERDIENTSVIKGGETCIDFSLERSSEGLKAIIKASPRVEEFMKGLGTEGELIQVSGVNRFWVPSKGNSPLTAYSLNSKIEEYGKNPDSEFHIDRLGAPLIEPIPDYRKERVNLSFLRLVGISEGMGVPFYVRGVYSKDMVNKMLDQIGIGLRRLYIDFIRPMNVNVQISLQSL